MELNNPFEEVLAKLKEAEQKAKESGEPQFVGHPTPQAAHPQVNLMPDTNHTDDPGQQVIEGFPQELVDAILGPVSVGGQNVTEDVTQIQAKPTVPAAPVSCACMGCRDKRQKLNKKAKQEQAQAQAQERLRQQEATPTCKFYSPPANVGGANKAQDYPFNRLTPATSLCGNPEIVGVGGFKNFMACGFAEAQTACPGYEPGEWEMISQAQLSDEKNTVVAVRRHRFGLSTRWVYEVVSLVPDEDTVVIHRVDSAEHGEQSLETAQELQAMELENFKATGHSSKSVPVEVKTNPSYIATVTAA